MSDITIKLITHALIRSFLSLVFYFSLINIANSQTIYKTVDEDGNISYSTVKPVEGTDAEIIAVPPEPTEEEVNAAIQRQEKLANSRKDRRDQQNKARNEKKKNEIPSQRVQKEMVIPVPIFRQRPIIPTPF
jgi:hypothetical protein